MVFEPTFESIGDHADALPDLAGEDPFSGDEDGADLDASGGRREEDDAGVAEGGVESDLIASEAPLEELPPYGEQ